MALKPKKPCANCKRELTRGAYCPKCSVEKEQEKKEAHRQYKRKRQDIEEQRFYSSSKWIRLREIKKRLNPLCERCLKKGKYVPVEIVHHIVPIKEDWSKRLELSNLESLCFRCHNEIHHAHG